MRKGIATVSVALAIVLCYGLLMEAGDVRAQTSTLDYVAPGVMSGDIYHIHTDYIDRPYMVSAPTITGGPGDILWYADYYPFGEVMTEIGSIAIGDPSTTGFYWTPPFRFPGQYEDEETGLFYNWNRYYIPELGRYNKVDPFSASGECGLGEHLWQIYTYSGNNPIFFFDPEGLYTKYWHRTITNMFDTCSGGKLAEANVLTDKDELIWHSCEYHWPTEAEYTAKLQAALDSCSGDEFGRALHALQDYHSHVLKPRKMKSEWANKNSSWMCEHRLLTHKKWVDNYDDPNHPEMLDIDHRMREQTQIWVKKWCDAYAGK